MGRHPQAQVPPRQRVPAPLMRRRLPSGRGATEQPNATGDGDAALSLRFWCALVLTGVAAGLFGAALMWGLFTTEHLVYGYRSGPFESAVERSSDVRRVVALVVAGIVGGLAWYGLRRATPGERADVDDIVWRPGGRLSFRRCLGTSVISELVIGAGASLGREQAPKMMGAASGERIAGWLGLSSAQRRLLVACGGGAGLAAVYNVPLGGALFTMEVLLGSAALPSVLPTVACCFVATATTWVYLPSHASYIDIPSYHLHLCLLAWACLVGPLVGVLSTGYIRLLGWVTYHRATGARSVPAMVGSFGLLGLIGWQYPQLFGNGKDAAHDVFIGHGTVLVFLALFALKPLVTAAALGSGASGGVFTPTLATGALLGGCLGGLWSHVWPGGAVGAYAMIGAAAMIGASMQAPLCGLALVLELTHSGFSLMVPMMLATVLATAVSRYLDGYSIYSARLPGDADLAEPGPAHAGAPLKAPNF
ncbi:MAG TPA: chloride channel protein [Acidimicrobiales bacterium]|nr:chloride channel protein [Acidimicrobiales bacterium]